MTTSTDIDHSWPDPAPDPALDGRAAASLGALFGARPAFAADLERPAARTRTWNRSGSARPTRGTP